MLLFVIFIRRKYYMDKSEFHKKYIRTPEFGEVRKAVLERDGHKCVICGRTDNLVCHHTSYKHLGQHNQAEIDDCVTLCQLDHVNHHRGKYNINWYSVDHPRNNDDLREVEFDGNRILVRSNGLDFYDARTFKKIKVHINKNRSCRNIICIGNKNYFCNRVVAKAFPEICGEWFDECEVHHIDEDPTNDKAENLMVLSHEDHVKMEHPKTRGHIGYTHSIPVYQYTLSGNYITKWKSTVTAAERLGISRSGIANVVCGISDTSGGYMWKQFEEGQEIPLWVEPILSGAERTKIKQMISISQYTKEGEWVRDWLGLDEPTKYYGGKSKSSINNVLNGRSKTAFGFIWKHKE